MADKPKKIVTNGPANFVLKDGGFAIVQTGEPVPDNLADGQLEHKQAAGAFDEPRQRDWAAMAEGGIVPAPENTAGRAEAAEQAVDAATAPAPAAAPAPSPAPPAPVPTPPAV